MKQYPKLKTIIFGLAVLQMFVLTGFAQKAKPVPAKTVQNKVPPKTPAPEIITSPKVIQIDETALASIVKPNGKPLLVNFWATWCDPCREEFPEFVKMSADYKDKLDIITISMDDLAEINREVPKFLSKVNAEMPAYLLKATDDDAAMKVIDTTWQGGLPYTMLINTDGTIVYKQQGKIKAETVRGEIEKIVGK